MTLLDLYASSYAIARQRFRDAASALGWRLEAFPIDEPGPEGEELTIDVAHSEKSEPGKVLVVSSGVHGVEGFFGSAIQLGLLQRWAAESEPPVKCVFLHGLNPFGFAWLRRFDEFNIDPNRNFLLAGEEYKGSPPDYARLDRLLNPPRAPSRWDPFTLKAMLAILRYGMRALRNSVAAGQYDFPKGLFFGGSGPNAANLILAENMQRWLHSSEQVVHIDFHTGLGEMGACKLLIDSALTAPQRARLVDWYGEEAFEDNAVSEMAYQARGGFGPWCIAKEFAPDYLFVCAEYGTYSPVRVISGLRTENQSHHWGNTATDFTIQAKQQLKELFCPASNQWRTHVLKHGMDIVQRAVEGLRTPQ